MPVTRAILTTSLGVGVGLMYFLHARRARRQASMRGKLAYAANRSWKAMRHAGSRPRRTHSPHIRHHRSPATRRFLMVA